VLDNALERLQGLQGEEDVSKKQKQLMEGGLPIGL
jgi:hypothetical protein